MRRDAVTLRKIVHYVNEKLRQGFSIEAALAEIARQTGDTPLSLRAWLRRSGVRVERRLVLNEQPDREVATGQGRP